MDVGGKKDGRIVRSKRHGRVYIVGGGQQSGDVVGGIRAVQYIYITGQIVVNKGRSAGGVVERKKSRGARGNRAREYGCSRCELAV